MHYERDGESVRPVFVDDILTRRTSQEETDGAETVEIQYDRSAPEEIDGAV